MLIVSNVQTVDIVGPPQLSNPIVLLHILFQMSTSYQREAIHCLLTERAYGLVVEYAPATGETRFRFPVSTLHIFIFA